jgi:hypothetical protein
MSALSRVGAHLVFALCCNFARVPSNEITIKMKSKSRKKSRSRRKSKIRIAL